ncbi:hypothetical protein AAFF_G00123080 [Aldrovandia affinis]|uniref:KN motif and ankyrin repeat domain-containing protein 2 n=1 Tax=Aldrovandia affinis TaxID=143900 RepID=A0AAD7RRR4_9TELE|nr:hypothetical protein AAFF_G00123080 [Aldrovandia affinis]
MAQVLHMDSSFPGTSNPAPAPSLLGKADLPYSVETPYGYRLDLDFLKYVNDIEKGNTIKRVPIQRRPRYNSLPRGYGYTGSWWTSTESLCSNVSMDSRHSSYSYCAPGYQASRASAAGGAFSLSAARVEKTLLDARRRLEEEKAGRRLSGLGSARSSVAGSTTSLASVHRTPGGGGQFTPMSSGLSTPVCPTPAHLQHVREQMALALRKIRELEEQAKTIPVLQVKISVLQEEKRQLSVQLKSQKFLGHTLGHTPGYGKSRPQGELYIHIPEEEAATSPTTPGGSKQDSGCEIEDKVMVGGGRPGGRREVRSIGVGTEEEQGQEALRSRVGELEAQLKRTLQELQVAQRERANRPLLRADHAVRATSVGWPGGGAASRQDCRRWSALPSSGSRGLWEFSSVECRRHETRRTEDTLPELPIAVCSKEVREVLQKSELSTSMPVSRPAIAMETICNQMIPLCERLKEGGALQQTGVESIQSQQDTSKSASPQYTLRSIMKRKPGSPSTKKNLQFIGVNGGYESTSSEDSSSESSEEESDVSEYHETTERLPESPAHHHADQHKTQEEVLQKTSSAHSVSQETRLELSDSLKAALLVLQKALNEPNAFGQQEARSAYTTVLQEWLRVSCHKTADEGVLLEFVVNMSDGNGNTALHYTVSHSNFPVVKLLLDTGLCNADKQNKAGYTAIMLTALAAFHSDSDLHTVVQLLRTGDVNAKASQAGQTALMLAVSHGRGDMVRALLSCGAQVNMRDEDGSTALMCACEHGHVDIVRQLLSVPDCDATLEDNDGSTALSIALEACQNDIAVLLYAHLNFAKPPSPVSPKSPQLSSPNETK